ncbi:MAG: hypothetical protein GY809_24265 [Planctomycetes bacterium]|nr:hypothetical protein [Planctomycetota bacterium]
MASAHHHWPRRNVSWSVRRQCLLDFQHGLLDPAKEICVCAVCAKGVERDKAVEMCIGQAEQEDDVPAVADAEERLGVDAFLRANNILTDAAKDWFREHARATFGCCLHPDGVVDYNKRTFLVCGDCKNELRSKKPEPPPLCPGEQLLVWWPVRRPAAVDRP